MYAPAVIPSSLRAPRLDVAEHCSAACVTLPCSSSLRGSSSQLVLGEQNAEGMWSPWTFPGVEGSGGAWAVCPKIGGQS